MDDALRRRLRRAALMMKLSIAADSVAAVVGLVVALNPDYPPGKRVFGGFFAALALAIIAQLLWLLRRTRAQRRRIHQCGGEG
jgi:CDP-diglyceride synthetase